MHTTLKILFLSAQPIFSRSNLIDHKTYDLSNVSRKTRKKAKIHKPNEQSLLFINRSFLVFFSWNSWELRMCLSFKTKRNENDDGNRCPRKYSFQWEFQYLHNHVCLFFTRRTCSKCVWVLRNHLQFRPLFAFCVVVVLFGVVFVDMMINPGDKRNCNSNDSSENNNNNNNNNCTHCATITSTWLECKIRPRIVLEHTQQFCTKSQLIGTLILDFNTQFTSNNK